MSNQLLSRYSGTCAKLDCRCLPCPPLVCCMPTRHAECTWPASQPFRVAHQVERFTSLEASRTSRDASSAMSPTLSLVSLATSPGDRVFFSSAPTAFLAASPTLLAASCPKGSGKTIDAEQRAGQWAVRVQAQQGVSVWAHLARRRNTSSPHRHGIACTPTVRTSSPPVELKSRPARTFRLSPRPMVKRTERTRRVSACVRGQKKSGGGSGVRRCVFAPTMCDRPRHTRAGFRRGLFMSSAVPSDLQVPPRRSPRHKAAETACDASGGGGGVAAVRGRGGRQLACWSTSLPDGAAHQRCFGPRCTVMPRS